jgi:hypothetical protein
MSFSHLKCRLDVDYDNSDETAQLNAGSGTETVAFGVVTVQKTTRSMRRTRRQDAETASKAAGRIKIK